jgi:hypothetical protein
MGLIDRFTALFRQQEQPTKTTSDELPRPARPTATLDRFKVEHTRREIVGVCRRMYDEDPRAEGVIGTLARDATMGGFKVKVVEGADPERAEQEASEMIERLGLFQRLDDWARLSFRDGDSFLELSVDADGLIQEVTRKPTLEMHRNSNDKDRFDDPARAFWWADRMLGSLGPPRDAVWFAEWQIIHARHNHDEGSRYGRPLFAAARGPWKRVNEGELDIAIRRKTRAGMKFLHVLEDASPADLEAYKEKNKDALDNPFAAVADFFTNKKGMIQAVQGDARLSEIDDVVHHIRTWWISSPVPMSLLGYGQDLSRDVLQEQKEQYDRALISVTKWITDQLAKPLLTRQWLLRGIWAGGLKYEIEWAVKQALNAAVLKDLAEALLKLKATTLFTDEMLIRIAAQIIPGIDVDALLAEMARQAAERPDEIGRMAGIAGG